MRANSAGGSRASLLTRAWLLTPACFPYRASNVLVEIALLLTRRSQKSPIGGALGHSGSIQENTIRPPRSLQARPPQRYLTLPIASLPRLPGKAGDSDPTTSTNLTRKGK